MYIEKCMCIYIYRKKTPVHCVIPNSLTFLVGGLGFGSAAGAASSESDRAMTASGLVKSTMREQCLAPIRWFLPKHTGPLAHLSNIL